MNTIVNGHCLSVLKTLVSESIDFICTDPPYGYNFMGKDWDKAVPGVELWQECYGLLCHPKRRTVERHRPKPSLPLGVVESADLIDAQINQAHSQWRWWCESAPLCQPQ